MAKKLLEKLGHCLGCLPGAWTSPSLPRPADIPTGAELWCVVLESRQQIGSRNYGYLVVYVAGRGRACAGTRFSETLMEEKEAGKRDPALCTSRCFHRTLKSGQMSARG